MLCVSVQSGSSFLEKEGKGGEGGEGREEGRREDLLLLGPPLQISQSDTTPDWREQ